MNSQNEVYVDLVKTWINEDIESNKARFGVDYTGELAKVLLSYLEFRLPDPNKVDVDKVATLMSMVEVGDLEKAIEYGTGMLPDFTKTKNAAVPVFRIRITKDNEAVEELLHFAAELNRVNHYDIPN